MKTLQSYRAVAPENYQIRGMARLKWISFPSSGRRRLSGMSSKWRWLVVIVAVGLVAGVVVMGFVVLREDPEAHPPRLVFLRQVEKDGQRVAVFRFDAPKRKEVAVATVWMQNLATGKASDPMRAFDLSVLNLDLRYFNLRYAYSPWLEIKAGQSKEFCVAAAPEQAWRLRCQFLVRATRIHELRILLGECWDTKSLRPLGQKKYFSSGTLESDLITNAVPRTAETPTK